MSLFRSICILGGIALPFMASAASSQGLQVHVPFSFILAGEEFAPGDYKVQQNDNGVVLVQGNGKAGLVISVPSRLAKPGVSPSLQFTSNQQREYLVGINMEDQTGRAIPTHFEESRRVTYTSAHSR